MTLTQPINNNRFPEMIIGWNFFYKTCKQTIQNDGDLRGGGGAGRGNGKILNGHTFVNTHQNCTKFSVVVYCVDIE